MKKLKYVQTFPKETEAARLLRGLRYIHELLVHKVKPQEVADEIWLILQQPPNGK